MIDTFAKHGWVHHHCGVPTTKPQPREKYCDKLKYHTTPGDNFLRIQYHRFEPECSLHPLIQKPMHLAFKVPDLEAALAGPMRDAEVLLFCIKACSLSCWKPV